MAHVEQLHEPPADEHDPAPGMLVVETDGVMVRYRDRHLDGTLVEGDWHEVKVGVVGGWQHGQLQQASYVAARETAPAFAPRLGAEAARRGALDVVKWHPWDGTPAELRPVVVLGDGAKWIWEHVATLFGDERTEIVDWYHASEHIWTAAKALHGEDTPETKAWANTALDHLWTGRSNPCWSGSMPPSLELPLRPRLEARARLLQHQRGSACSTRPSASGTCRLALVPWKPRPSTSSNSA